VGSFLNVVIDRVPDKSPLRGERDGEASAPVSFLGVPAQPWLLRNRGQQELPGRWWQVELVTAAVFALIGARYGFSSTAVPLLLLGASLVAVSVIDLQLLRIPDRITFPTLAIAIPLIALIAVTDDRSGSLRAGLLGAAVYFALLFVPHLIYPAGMGFGDVKLALALGVALGWYGWAVLFAGGFAGFLFGALYGAGLMVMRRAGRRTGIPFGPFMIAGALTGLLLGGLAA
jgi:leader peptidase (prepilin peptidase)/N-methyltransferase